MGIHLFLDNPRITLVVTYPMKKNIPHIPSFTSTTGVFMAALACLRKVRDRMAESFVSRSVA